MGTVLHLRTINQTTEPRSQQFYMAKSKRQLVRFPWAADSCPWVGKLRTVLPFTNRDVIRDGAVQLTRQRGVDSPGRIGGWFEGRTDKGGVRSYVPLNKRLR
jgi:hypothetical protein